MFGLITLNVLGALITGFFLWIAIRPTAPSSSQSDSD